MRTVSLDSETTGGSPKAGDRACEIGLVEMVDGRRTGRTWRSYFNPKRKVHFGALRVHGLTNKFLSDKPLFEERAEEILDFIDGAPCKAHNARFDRDVLINEFAVTGLEIPKLEFYDTIPMAKKLLSGGRFKLDILVERLGITAPDRKLHGALLDAEILGMVVERLEDMRPGFVADYIGSNPCLNHLPKFLEESGLAPELQRPSRARRSAPRSPFTPAWVEDMDVTFIADREDAEVVVEEDLPAPE
jgi:DNA polymerase III subunit epsilon